MATNKKRKNTHPFVQLNPKKYIVEKARSLPVYQCVINGDWRTSRMANIFISRRMPSGNLIIGVYLVDLFCLGVKDSFYIFNTSDEEWEERLTDIPTEDKMEECAYSLVHNIIYGAVDFAAEAGINPHKDFAVSKFILEEDADIDPEEDIEFGQDGMHHYFVGPNDNVNYYLTILNKNLGKGNYTYTSIFDLE